METATSGLSTQSHLSVIRDGIQIDLLQPSRDLVSCLKKTTYFVIKFYQPVTLSLPIFINIVIGESGTLSPELSCKKRII